MTHIERITLALVVASWWVIRGRWGSLAHCVEVSTSGARALAHYKIKARAVPCAFLAIDHVAATTVACGHSAQSLWEQIPADQRAEMDHAAWLAQHRRIDMPDPVHAAIDASHCGHRIFVDLTAGQVRGLVDPPIAVPDCIRFNEPGWPEVVVASGVGLRYGPSPNEPAARRLIASAPSNQGLVDDFISVMDFALACNLDRDAFTDGMIATAEQTGTLDEVLQNHAAITGRALPPSLSARTR
jgi:hypothetical protein